MQVIQPRLQSWGELYPNQLDGLALWLDSIDQNSLLASDGSVIEDGEAVALWSDKSGNSAENCLVLNGVAGNYASAPDSAALSITGDIEVIFAGSLDDWSDGTSRALVGKYDTGANKRSYLLNVNLTGSLQFTTSPDGSTPVIAASDSIASWDNFSERWIKVTRDVDNGAGGNTTTFYTSDDRGHTWDVFGSPVVNAGTTSIYDSDVPLTIGAQLSSGTAGSFASGKYKRVIIRSGIGGSDVFDADFTAQPKLATSFTESSSNAATVTINTTGATGARISGARDRYQGTVANRPVYSVSERSVTTDGTNDYMKGLAFSQGQPITIYAAMQQVTWTSGDYLFDGNTNDTLALIQTTSTPQLNISAGSSVAANTGLAVATKGVVSAIYNGANSSLRINRGTATTGNAGAGTANGLTIGSKADGSAAGNGKYYEILVYSGAHDTATRDRITQYLGRKWGIAV